MGRPLSDDWRNWLRENRERGCALDDLYQRAARQGFSPEEIAAELGGYRPAIPIATVPPHAIAANDAPDCREPWFSLFHAPLTRPDNKPRAWRLDTDLAQLYEIPNFLTQEECEALIKVIDTSLQPSTVTRGAADYRTSRTCHMRKADPEFVKLIDARIARLIGVDSAYSEPIQGQRYDEGQYFKAHTDWFAPDTEEYKHHTNPGGQRTWTVMIWLNRVPEGGATRFERIGRDFFPVQGSAVAWNNCGIDGKPNHNTLHEAMPVIQGSKYVITKWFREKTGRND
jgi:prolyl 4-hydroxylase